MSIKIFPLQTFSNRKFIELQQHNTPIYDTTEVHYYAHWRPVEKGEIEYIKTYCVAIFRIKWKKRSFVDRGINFLKKFIIWV